MVITKLHRQACVQPQLALGVRQQCCSEVRGGGSQSWRESTKQGLGRIAESCPWEPHCPLSHVSLPPCGSPFAMAAAMELWLSRISGIHRTWGYSLPFPCVSLSLAHTPCLLCQMTKKKHISAGERFMLVDKNEFQLAYFQMNPCDLWPMEMVALIKSRLRNQACLVWLVVLWYSNLSISVASILWRC